MIWNVKSSCCSVCCIVQFKRHLQHFGRAGESSEKQLGTAEPKTSSDWVCWIHSAWLCLNCWKSTVKHTCLHCLILSSCLVTEHIQNEQLWWYEDVWLHYCGLVMLEWCTYCGVWFWNMGRFVPTWVLGYEDGEPRFLPRDAMQAWPTTSRGVCVCLSRSYILSKRITISSNVFHHRVATPF